MCLISQEADLRITDVTGALALKFATPHYLALVPGRSFECLFDAEFLSQTQKSTRQTW
jgi:hypothetical protein